KSNILMYQSGDDFDKVAQRLDAYLQNPSRPTAIACYNDQLAIRVMDYLKGRGLKLPADISIVGFDDYHMSQYMSPGITTMNHEKTTMGEDTGKQMLRLLNKQPVESIKYDPQLIVRDSV
ncbi:substrate-binding domain-containing protein, partial [Lactiplantibacillus plantarum]